VNTPLVAGVDGASGGWIAAVAMVSDEPLRCVFAESIAELIDSQPAVSHWAIDTPIALLDAGLRECDALARQLLGAPRSSSVFTGPTRGVLDAPGYVEACEVSLRACGRKLSKQAWNIVPKIREVRRLLEQRPDLRGRVFETHPEVCFARLAGHGIAASKKTTEGRSTRQQLLAVDLGRIAVERFVATATTCSRGVATDDALDALAAWTAAARIATGAAQSLPAEPCRDALGLRVAIDY
jgi:predicted RNase H-like nuclease